MTTSPVSSNLSPSSPTQREEDMSESFPNDEQRISPEEELSPSSTLSSISSSNTFTDLEENPNVAEIARTYTSQLQQRRRRTRAHRRRPSDTISNVSSVTISHLLPTTRPGARQQHPSPPPNQEDTPTSNSCCGKVGKFFTRIGEKIKNYVTFHIPEKNLEEETTKHYDKFAEELDEVNTTLENSQNSLHAIIAANGHLSFSRLRTLQREVEDLTENIASTKNSRSPSKKRTIRDLRKILRKTKKAARKAFSQIKNTLSRVGKNLQHLGRKLKNQDLLEAGKKISRIARKLSMSLGTFQTNVLSAIIPLIRKNRVFTKLDDIHEKIQKTKLRLQIDKKVKEILVFQIQLEALKNDTGAIQKENVDSHNELIANIEKLKTEIRQLIIDSQDGDSNAVPFPVEHFIQNSFSTREIAAAKKIIKFPEKTTLNTCTHISELLSNPIRRKQLTILALKVGLVAVGAIVGLVFSIGMTIFAGKTVTWITILGYGVQIIGSIPTLRRSIYTYLLYKKSSEEARQKHLQEIRSKIELDQSQHQPREVLA